ncbi:MAG: hypothetical protein O3B13_13615 [Planctomycetota bacterium]|nr:hypothetical protein [Planctomycetota bacterium]
MSVSEAKRSQAVFNIEVQGDHVYRVSEAGILVHNTSVNPSLRPTVSPMDLGKYSAEDCSNPECYITARRKGNVITFTVVAKPKKGKTCRVKGHEFFEAMIKHFGRRATTVRAEWLEVEGFEDNLRIYNTCISANKSPDTCAKSTKTGKWATGAGFTNVKIIREEGAKGDYHEVIVEFSK